MKWIYTTVILAISLCSNATVRTVSNVPANLAQFSTIASAVSASANGDTILIHGTPLAYDQFTINNKRLVLIGPGFNPDAQSAFPARVNNTISINGSLSKHTEIQGMVFEGLLDIGSVDSIRLIRNKINNIQLVLANGTIRGMVFRGNFITGIIDAHGGATYQNFVFENNVFKGARFEDFSAAPDCFNNLFNHNLFFTVGGVNTVIFQNINNASFANNIFIEKNFNTGDAGVEYCTFHNNITYLCNPNDPWLLPTNTNGGGNIAGMNPQMADQTNVENGTAGELSNYTIEAGPANNAGTDGKDMGLLYDSVGGLNWIHGRNSRMPSVSVLNITNPVLTTGGSLQISIEARKNE